MKIIPVLLLALACTLSSAAGTDEFSIPAWSVQAFARSFQSALKEKDVTRVADMVSYPLRFNLEGGKFRRVGKAQLIKEYDQIFSPAVVKEVLAQDPGDLFQNYQGVMFGNGAVWANEFCEGRKRPDCPLRVITVNQLAR